MSATRARQMFARFDAAEHSVCLRLNRGCGVPSIHRLFSIVSRLGDGAFWYALLVLLPLMYGANGREAALEMAVAGVAGVMLYKALKNRLVRERPYISLHGVSAGLAPLDRYSFPSGHTLHAVCFTTIAVAHLPGLAWVLVPFAALVAASRVVLGLHYPTDVAAGATLGAGLAAIALGV